MRSSPYLRKSAAVRCVTITGTLPGLDVNLAYNPGQPERRDKSLPLLDGDRRGVSRRVHRGRPAGAVLSSRAIDIVVPFPPGGGSDNLARTLQDIVERERLSAQPVTVSNRSGGSGAVGLACVAGRSGDGYTS